MLDIESLEYKEAQNECIGQIRAANVWRDEDSAQQIRDALRRFARTCIALDKEQGE